MRLVGICIAHDESPSMLSAAVAGFGRFCDAIVYCEGAYALYPGARPRSRPEEAQAVIQVCEALDVELLCHRPKDVYWGNEVEKRNKSLQLAGSLDPDWVVVFDADYHVIRCAPERIRAKLEQTELVCGTYTLLDGIDLLDQEPGFSDFCRSNEVASEWTIKTKDIYRWTPDLRYGPAHYTIRGTYGGVQHWVRGPEMSPGQHEHVSEPVDMLADLVVVHRREARAKVRKDASNGYYANRDAAGIESISLESLYA